jgi:hypothetical protein
VRDLIQRAILSRAIQDSVFPTGILANLLIRSHEVCGKGIQYIILLSVVVRAGSGYPSGSQFWHFDCSASMKPLAGHFKP